ncbi:MAG: hypothetical protein ACK4MT_10925, partial [Thermaurantiacus tibetensis]
DAAKDQQFDLPDDGLRQLFRCHFQEGHDGSPGLVGNYDRIPEDTMKKGARLTLAPPGDAEGISASGG